MRRRNNRPLCLLGYVSPRPELLANESVEQDADSSSVPDRWNISASGAEWATAEARSGDRSLRLHVAGATGEWIAFPFAVVAGHTYRLAAYVKGTGSTQTFLTIRWWTNPDGTGFIHEDNIMLNSVYADWTHVAQMFTAPANTQSADVMFRCPAATTADIYGDDFSVRQVN